jgi:HAD superfamily hydrolase (TIGR01509 family)
MSNRSLPRPVQAVIFDMDGLLIDSETRYRDAMTHVAKRYNRDLPLPVYLSMVGLPHPQSQAIAIDHFGEDFPIDAYHADVWAFMRAEHATGIALKTGVIELLDHLDDLRLPRAVATSSSHETVHHNLGQSGILSRFQAVIAAGDYARGKPNPDPFLTAAERLGVDPAFCLALEDSHNGVRAAHAAGMMTIMVPDMLEATEEMRSLCVTIAETLHDVRELLEVRMARTTTHAAAG